MMHHEKQTRGRPAEAGARDPGRPAVARRVLGAVLCLAPALAVLGDRAVAQPAWHEVPYFEVRIFHAMAHDPIRGRVVAFGGNLRNDTWEWDGQRWQRRFPATSPPNRSHHAMAFDPVTRRVILFGGIGDYGKPIYGDTWAWDGRDWTELSPAQAPKPRLEHRMATDLLRGRLVLFGGSITAGGFGGDTPVDDTWEWDGKTWVQRFPATVPGKRWAHAMAFCIRSRRVVMFGGVDRFRPVPGTWEWDGTDWTRHAPAAEPSLRTRHGMAADPASGEVLLHGGDLFDSFGRNNRETWSWDGRTWRFHDPTTIPDARRWPYLAPDLARRQVVMLGLGGRGPQETWIWDRGDWSWRGRPTWPRFLQAVAHHASRDEFVCVGPSSGIDWARHPLQTLVMRDGTFVDPAPKTQPPIRQVHGMVYHAGVDRTVLFGGGDPWRVPAWKLRDTWLWDGSEWTEHKTATQPPGELYPRLVYDSRREKVVMFTSRGETWEWDARGWVQRTPATSPPPLKRFAFAYDPVRARTVLFGGWNAAGVQRRTWEWDGSDWADRTLGQQPPWGGDAYHMDYVPALGGVAAFSGIFGTVWVWDGKSWTKLAVPYPGPGPDTLDPYVLDFVYDAGRQRARAFFVQGSIYHGAWELTVRKLSADQPLPRLGERLTLSAYVPGQAGRRWLLGLAGAGRPGVPLRAVPFAGTELLPLRPDPILSATIQAGLGGVLDSQGRGRVTFDIPVDPSLHWQALHAAAVTLGPGGIGTITNGVPMEIVR